MFVVQRWVVGPDLVDPRRRTLNICSCLVELYVFDVVLFLLLIVVFVDLLLNLFFIDDVVILNLVVVVVGVVCLLMCRWSIKGNLMNILMLLHTKGCPRPPENRCRR